MIRRRAVERYQDGHAWTKWPDDELDDDGGREERQIHSMLDTVSQVLQVGCRLVMAVDLSMMVNIWLLSLRCCLLFTSMNSSTVPNLDEQPVPT